MRKVLIANRGEIAVRIARACKDAGLGSVAVYAEPDIDGLHVRIADEAYALGGHTAAESYLDIEKIIKVAAQAGADAVHPGYGFLAENADFAQAVLDAGMVWIGPPPAAIRSLGDKVQARRIAMAAGAPLAPGTKGPVSGIDEVAEFAREHGLPVAIKAAYGGGGRGLKVARTLEEIPQQYESAVREATAAFGRGECFAERYLDRPRHVETQCLADIHGNVTVVSTRDCSLQRRHQKLVEEAPAPFLSAEQVEVLYASSKAILREAGYVGAGTCEFLIGQDGTVSFLEVNTRLQVEHPVTEEVTGIDLVQEMFRIAEGQRIGYGDPPARAHSIEFRVNAEDAGRNFLPAPGKITRWRQPGGPGVRVDAGYREGMTVPRTFDSLIAKLIVTGSDRRQALARARRALAEFQIDGMPTVLPFHRAVAGDAAFTSEPLRVHTRWIETEFGGVEPYTSALDGDDPATAGARAGAGAERERITVEVGGKRLEVVLPPGFLITGDAASGGAHGTMDRLDRPAMSRSAINSPAMGRSAMNRPAMRGAARGGRAARAGARGSRGTPASHGDATLASPMQGTIVKLVAEEGQHVSAGDTVVVLEAMKMEQPLAAHKDGTIKGLSVTVGQNVSSGEAICQIGD